MGSWESAGERGITSMTSRSRTSSTVVVQRTLIGATAIFVLLSLILVDVAIADFASKPSPLPGLLADLLARGSVIPLIFLATVLGGVFELDRLLRKKGANPYVKTAYVGVAALMIVPWFSAAGLFGHKLLWVEGLFGTLAILSAISASLVIRTVLRFDPHNSLTDFGATLLIIFYLGFLPSFAIQMRCDANRPEQDGAWLILILLLMIKATDIGGFLIGSWLGRHKLIPSISPGKSVEGAIGGMAASALVAFLAAYLAGLLDLVPNHIRLIQIGDGRIDLLAFLGDMSRALNWSVGPLGMPKPIGVAVFAIAVSVMAQFGDLVESCFKRDAGMKDSSNLIPRAGGILDLIDSPIAALPVAWLILTLV